MAWPPLRVRASVQPAVSADIAQRQQHSARNSRIRLAVSSASRNPLPASGAARPIDRARAEGGGLNVRGAVRLGAVALRSAEARTEGCCALSPDLR